MASIVNVDDEVGERIDRLVASGSFGSRDAVVAEGIRLVQEREEWLRMVDAKVAEGQAQIARGEAIDAEVVFAELRDRYRDWPK